MDVMNTVEAMGLVRPGPACVIGALVFGMIGYIVVSAQPTQVDRGY